MLWSTCPFLHKKSIVRCCASSFEALPKCRGQAVASELTWASHLAGEKTMSKDDLLRKTGRQRQWGVELGTRIQGNKWDLTEGSAYFDVIGVMSKPVCLEPL